MKTKAIAVTMTLLFSLILSFTIVAEALEISYDDGQANAALRIGDPYKVGIMFKDLPYSQNLINTISIRVYYEDQQVQRQQLEMYFLDSSFQSIHDTIFTPILQAGWNNIDVSNLNIVSQGSFLIGLHWSQEDGTYPGNVYLGFDTDSSANLDHSYDYNTGKWQDPFWGSPANPGGGVGIWMIRADVSAVPLPPTVLLLGSSLLGLAGWRRFRKG